MLKRHQVLLTDWLTKHLKDVSEKYDLSFSEVIRVTLCLQLAQNISLAYPEHRLNLSMKQVAERVKKKNSTNQLEEEDLHKFISRIYFETRKAIEFWEAKEKKRKK